MRRHLNELIAKDIKERERSIKDRFDEVLVTALINACKKNIGDAEVSEARVIDTEEAVCIIRRFLTLTHDMGLDAADAVLARANQSTVHEMEMSR